MYVYIFQVFIVESSAYIHVIITTLDGLQQMASTCDIPVRTYYISLRFHHACNVSFKKAFYWHEEVDLVEIFTKVFTYIRRKLYVAGLLFNTQFIQDLQKWLLPHITLPLSPWIFSKLGYKVINHGSGAPSFTIHQSLCQWLGWRHSNLCIFQ